MATTIKTSSKNYFSKIQKYLHNKRVFFTPSLNLGVYALTIFDLTEVETTSLFNKMTKHFHLTKPHSRAEAARSTFGRLQGKNTSSLALAA